MATLIVVMVLLFVVTMVAAYSSRNIIFEQRTGANYYRSLGVQTAADAGLQWALRMLNGGRIDTSCAASAVLTDTSFRERYLTVTPGADTYGLVPAAPPPTCVFDPDTGGWSCECQPAGGTPALAAPGSPQVAPAFRVWMTASPRPGTLQVTVVACTRLDDNCLQAASTTPIEINQARASARALLYQTGVSTSAPIAPLSARGGISAEGLTLTNSRVGDSGVTAHLGGDFSIDPAFVPTLNTLAGNALGGTSSAIALDAALAPADIAAGAAPDSVAVSGAERFFAALFKMGVQTAREQPAMLMLGDCGGGCDGDDVRTAAAQNPGRPMWIEGDLDIATSGDIGSPTAPVLLIVDDGQFDIGAAGVTVHGLVFVRPPAGTPWSVPSQGRVRGAVVVDGDVGGGTTGGSFEIDYDGELLRLVRLTAGSFTLVPGSWQDR